VLEIGKIFIQILLRVYKKSGKIRGLIAGKLEIEPQHEVGNFDLRIMISLLGWWKLKVKKVKNMLVRNDD